MSTNDKKPVDEKTVQLIVQALTDSSQAYASAAERADLGYLEQTFRDVAERRDWFAAQLQVAADGRPTSSRSLTGTLREWWMTVRDQLSADHYGLLAELERSEDAILMRYKRVLAEGDGPEGVEQVLREQLSEIQETHDRIRDLRDSEKAARQA